MHFQIKSQNQNSFQLPTNYLQNKGAKHTTVLENLKKKLRDCKLLHSIKHSQFMTALYKYNIHNNKKHTSDTALYN